MRHLFLTLFVVFLLGSCAEKDALRQYRPEVTAPHEVEIIPEDETLVLSDLVGKYELIEPKGTLLAYVAKALAYDSIWIVNANSVEGGGVHQFDAHGNFMKTILKGGEGPYEATSLFSMKLVNDDLYFLINAGVRLLHYSLKEGQFVEGFMLPDEIRSAKDFAVLGNGKYLFYKDRPSTQGDDYKLYAYDQRENKITHRWIPMNKQASQDYLLFGQSNCLYQRDGKCYFYEVFQRGIFEVDADRLEGYVAFRDNQYTIPDDELYSNYPTLVDFIGYCKESPYIWSHRSIYEGERFILSSFMYRDTDYHWNVIDKNQWTNHSYTRMKDDILLDTEIPLNEYLPPIGVQGDTRYFCLSYDLLQKVMEQKEANGELDAYAKAHPDVMKLYENMNENSNDLIVVFHEKQ